MMAGGEELDELGHELEEFARSDSLAAAKLAEAGHEFEAEAREIAGRTNDPSDPAVR